MNVPKLRFKEFDGEVKKYKIKEVFNVQTGLTPLRSNLDYFSPKYISWIKTLDLNDSLIYETEEHVSELALSKTSLKIVPPNTVLIAMYGGFNQIGRTGLTTVEATTNQAISALIPNENMRIHPYFIQTYLNAHKNYWKSLAASSRKDPNITKKDIEKFSISIPEFLEQQKLGEFFGLLNKKIQLHQQKIDLLQEQKKGFLQKMFPKIGEKQPEMRFVGFTGDWEQHNLGDILIERNIHKPQSEYYPLVSFTVEKGVTPKTDRYEREQLVVGDKASKKYKVTELNDIVYNPANLKFGAIARNKYGKAVFSPIYVTFEVNDKLVYPNYVEMFVTRRDFIQYSLRYQQGTVYERQSVSPENLLSQTFSLPCMKEQQKIGAFFKKLDDTIGLHQQKLDLYKEQKKGFMQQMFI